MQGSHLCICLGSTKDDATQECCKSLGTKGIHNDLIVGLWNRTEPQDIHKDKICGSVRGSIGRTQGSCES